MSKGTQQLLKVLVTPDYSSFIIAKKNNNMTTLITPFKRTEQKVTSNLVLPANRIQRAQGFCSIAPEICLIDVSHGELKFDILSKISEEIPTEYFEGDTGIFMFNYNNTPVQEVTPICSFKTWDIIPPMTFKTDPVTFKTDRLKVFPVILTNGFIVSIVEQTNTVTTYITIENPETGLVGKCEHKEVPNIFNYLFSLWGQNVFELKIFHNFTEIFIDKKLCEMFNDPWPSLVKMVRRNTESEEATIQKIADFNEIHE